MSCGPPRRLRNLPPSSLAIERVQVRRVRHASRCFDFGAEIDTAVVYLLEWNSGKCFPPTDTDEVDRTVRSAAKSRKKPYGCDHPLACGFDPYEMPAAEAESDLSPPALPPEKQSPPCPNMMRRWHG